MTAVIKEFTMKSGQKETKSTQLCQPLFILGGTLLMLNTKREKTSNVFPIKGAFDFPSSPI